MRVKFFEQEVEREQQPGLETQSCGHLRSDSVHAGVARAPPRTAPTHLSIGRPAGRSEIRTREGTFEAGTQCHLVPRLGREELAQSRGSSLHPGNPRNLCSGLAPTCLAPRQQRAQL